MSLSPLPLAFLRGSGSGAISHRQRQHHCFESICLIVCLLAVAPFADCVSIAPQRDDNENDEDVSEATLGQLQLSHTLAVYRSILASNRHTADP